MKEEKYIKIRQNISWNRIGSKIMVRNSWKSVLTAECFFKKLGFPTASLSSLNCRWLKKLRDPYHIWNKWWGFGRLGYWHVTR